SRRRHTRSDRDWSSDVCSSDLNLCVQAGFSPPTIDLVRIEMTPESMRDIGRFSLFIEGALPGVPLEEGAAALEKGLDRAMDETGVRTVPRNWLECVATAA